MQDPEVRGRGSEGSKDKALSLKLKGKIVETAEVVEVVESAHDSKLKAGKRSPR